MRIAAFLIGLLIVLGAVLAAAPVGPMPMAQDVVSVHRNSTYNHPATLFANGTHVFVKVSDGTTNGDKRQIYIKNVNTTQIMSFFVYDDGTNNDDVANDGNYKGNFTISTLATNDSNDNIFAADTHIITIGSPSLIDIDSWGDGVQINITADYTPPTITPIFPTNDSATNNNNTAILFNVTDQESGVDNSTVNVNVTYGVNNVRLNVTNQSINYTATNDNEYGDGNVTVFVNASDNAGNIVSATWNFTVDTHPPNIYECNVTPNDTWIGSETNFTVTLKGDSNGSAWFEYNGNNYTMNDLSGGIYQLNRTVGTNGVWKNKIRCWLNDSAGNTNTTNTTHQLWADGAVPVITPISPANASFTNDNSTDVLFNVTDQGGGVNNSTVNVTMAYGVNNVRLNVTNQSINYTATNDNEYGDGNVTVFVNASDNAGNIVNTKWHFIVDTQAPSSVTMERPMNKTYNKQDIWYNFTANDVWSPNMYCNTSFIILPLGILGLKEITNATNHTPKFGNASSCIAFPDNHMYAYTECTDLAGNSKNSSRVYFTIDTTGPVITNTPNLNTTYMQNGTLLNFTIMDALSSVNSSWWNNGTGTNNTLQANSINTTGWSEGQHNITVYANDSVGNVGSAYFEFNIDDTPPAKVTGLNATGGAHKIDLEWNNVTDAHLAGYRVYNFTSGGGYTLLTTTNNTTTTYTDDGLSGGTTYYYAVSAIDSAGNEGNKSDEVSATTNAASTGGGGSGGGSGGGGSGSAQRVIRYHDDPPMPIEEPIVLPTPVPTINPVKQEPATTKPATNNNPLESGGWMKKPLGRKTLGPITGLLFKDGSFLYGLAALLALASVWIIWSLSKVRAKRKWYEK